MWMERKEPYLFLSLVIIHLLVLFRYEWYPTLDGPAHLYNAILIKQLVLGNDFLARYLEFSSFPEPNWSGHAIMAFLSLFLPANWVEKGLVLIVFTTTAYGFRALVNAHSARNSIAALLIFPFLCTFTLRIGFFNFSLSIGILLWLLAWYTRNRNSISDRSNILLFLFFGLLYFSHALTAVVGIGVIWSWKAQGIVGTRTFDRYTIKQHAAPLIASLPWLALIVLFIYRTHGRSETMVLSADRLLEIAGDGVPFTIHYGQAMMWAARAIGATLVILAIIILVYRLRSDRTIHRSDTWLLIALVSLAAYWWLPDSTATGGTISVRYLLFFYLFLAIWTAVQRWPAVANLFLLPYLLADLFLVRVDHSFTAELSDDVQALRSVIGYVEPNSVALPIIHSQNWFHGNFSTYLGTGEGVLMLDNYEAMAAHFPLRWKDGHRPPPADHATFYDSPAPCVQIEELQRSMQLHIDHVLRWKYDPFMTDSCVQDIDRQLKEGFQLVHGNGEVQFYGRR